jgi:uncharacterized protein (TIGR02145 family)
MKKKDFIAWRCLPLIFSLLLFLILMPGCSEDDTVDPQCTVGAACDDGNPITANDVYDADCDCKGTPICTVGAACDDDDPFTVNDVYNASCVCEGESVYGTLTDPRDGQTYQTIVIGTQTWMAENLNYETGSSWCYDDNADNCNVYGRLYTWETAVNACPAGWHLPTDAEWTTLADLYGGVLFGGGSLKSTGTLQAGTGLWEEPNTGATNESGFSCLPGGDRIHPNGEFGNMGQEAYLWSATAADGMSAWFRLIRYNEASVGRYNTTKDFGFSVRCISD